MITIETVVVSISGLERAEVEHWIALDWVRPEGEPGAWVFQEIDVARLRLIHELRHELQMEEDSLPVVLELMDQLYDARRRLRRLRDAVERTAPPEVQAALLEVLIGDGGEDGATRRASFCLAACAIPIGRVQKRRREPAQTPALLERCPTRVLGVRVWCGAAPWARADGPSPNPLPTGEGFFVCGQVSWAQAAVRRVAASSRISRLVAMEMRK